MSLASVFTSRRKRTRGSARRERPAVTDFRSQPGTDLAIPVPAAQVRAQREPGPQTALPVRQPAFAAHPGSGPQPKFTPKSSGPQPAVAPELPAGRPQAAPARQAGTHLRPAHVEPWEQEWLAANPHVPQGAHPYGPPPGRDPAERTGGPQRAATEAWRPEFAEEAALARPYAPAVHPLDPDTVLGEELQPALGYYGLKGEWPPLQYESGELKALRQQVMSLNYPKAGLRASFREYAAFMRTVNELTGTAGTSLWPLPAVSVTGSRPDEPAAWPPYTGPAVPVVVRRTVRVGAAA